MCLIQTISSFLRCVRDNSELRWKGSFATIPPGPSPLIIGALIIVAACQPTLQHCIAIAKRFSGNGSRYPSLSTVISSRSLTFLFVLCSFPWLMKTYFSTMLSELLPFADYKPCPTVLFKGALSVFRDFPAYHP